MTDLNKTCLVGRVVKQPELIKNNNHSRVTFCLAVNRNVKNKVTGEFEEKVSFFDMTIWDKVAENLHEYLTKGKVVSVEAHLEQDRWIDKEGKKKSKIEIVVDNINPFVESHQKSLSEIETQDDDYDVKEWEYGDGTQN